MAITANDISIVLSGGSYNVNPDDSLGGDPSNVTVSNSINNLFSDISQDELDNGLIDYRCIYIFNDNTTDSFFSIDLYVDFQISGGSTIQIGIKEATDVQTLTITGTASGGSFTVAYDSSNIIVNYDADPDTWASNFQTELNDLSSLDGVVVEATQSVGLTTFEIRFEGNSDNRNHPLLELVSNNLTGSPSISVTKTIEGSPINTVASAIASKTTTPSGVTFADTDELTPITLTYLGPEEGVPVWVKRIQSAGETPIQDGFSLKIKGSIVA